MRMMRATAIVAALLIIQGCQPKSPGEEQVSEATEPEAIGTANTSDLLKACELKMRAPETREWQTYWDARADGLVKEGPSSAGSPYWANEEELEKIKSGGGMVPPLSITCSAQSQEGQTEIAIGLGAYGSTEQEIPLGPGTYSIIGRFGGQSQPGAFVANLIFGETMFDANGGTLSIDRFDMKGVAGSFSVEAKEMGEGNRTLQLEGRFDLPCRGGPLQSKCTANKAIRE